MKLSFARHSDAWIACRGFSIWPYHSGSRSIIWSYMQGKDTCRGDRWGQKYDSASARDCDKVFGYRSSRYLSHLVGQSPTGPYCTRYDDHCTTRIFSKSFALINWISKSGVQFEIRNVIHVSCCQSYNMVALGAASKWPTRHHEILLEYMHFKDATFIPSRSWWVFASAEKSCTVLFHEYCISLHGRDTLFLEQSARLQTLLRDLRDAVKVKAPLSALDLLTTVGSDTVAGHIDAVNGTIVLHR